MVERIVTAWGDQVDLSKDQYRQLLLGLRADQLLAAGPAGTLDGLRTVVENAQASNTPVDAKQLRAKSLVDQTISCTRR